MPKTIVCLANGTWSERASGHATNVVLLCDMLGDTDKTRQVVKYDNGVGTGVFRLTGGALGVGLSANVRELYHFVAENYEPGDRVALFGFSCGAFTVRSLAGMIGTCGILKAPTDASVSAVFKAFKSRRRTDDLTFDTHGPQSRTAVHVIGVWDTVGALGVPFELPNRLNPWSHHFHDTSLSCHVPFAFQALAVDETRKVFAPTRWTNVPVPSQVVEQVWFVGAHSNVGGGLESRDLSDISLKWMCDKLQQHPAQVHFKPGEPAGLAPDEKGPIHQSRSGFYRLWPVHHRKIPDGAPVH